MSEKTIIGLTSPFGSGSSYVAKNLLAELDYKYISLSDILREEIIKRYPDIDVSNRTFMQDYGNAIREKEGNDFLSKVALERINEGSHEKWVIDSIRNANEVRYFRDHFGRFYLFALWADVDTRWNRIKEKYDDNDRKAFDADDKRDNDEGIINGQQVSICYKMADIVISNNKDFHKGNKDEKNFKKKITEYIDIIEKRANYVPNDVESTMCAAYTVSLRSSCPQRKVGALLVDEYGNIFSSGFNEVPVLERSCDDEYGVCHRKHVIDKFSEKIEPILNDEDKLNDVFVSFKKSFKALDYCRALHAEENTIINVARLGVSQSLSKSTLYTTTFPCRLCANKISQVGIRKIVYFEPYPMSDSKEILDKHGIEQEHFEGVTFNGYFRLMEVVL
jgi:deoxycytidylate deaminase/cytidylate kinase